MSYPAIDKSYGYKPVNLIGGQTFAGSTRQYPIQYAYNVNLFYGDPVTLSAGYTVTQALAVNTTAANTIIGVFLGCSYTNPATKQKIFSQYWPASTAAGDAVAYVADDPNTVFRAAVTTAAGATTIGSCPSLLVGQNLASTTVTTSGSTATGNRIVQTAGLKKFSMELGGKSPFVILAGMCFDTISIILFSINKDTGFFPSFNCFSTCLTHLCHFLDFLGPT